MANIPVAMPVLDEEEVRLVTKTIRSSWISSSGKMIDEFEKSFAKFCGAKYGVSASNGTTALHLALAALDIGPGDEVIVPAMTFAATANAVAYTGAKPVFVDSEKETWNIDPDLIKEKITRKTKAILPVHLYGHPADMKRIMAIGRKYNLLIVEDAAEAHGAVVKGKRVGSFGIAGCFSFFANKIITTGEGGMIVTNNKSFANKARKLRDHGASKRRKYHNPWLGFNYRITNMQAAVGVAQMKKIDGIIEKKRKIAGQYKKLLSPLVPDITLPPESDWAKSVFWMYSILIPSGGKMNRDILIEKLKKKGIETRPFFFPLNKLKRFKTRERMPVAEELGKTGINLPSSPTLTTLEIDRVCDTILTVFS